MVAIFQFFTSSRDKVLVIACTDVLPCQTIQSTYNRKEDPNCCYLLFDNKILSVAN